MVSYIKFVAGNNKGETNKGDVFNDAFRLGKVDENYTSNRVVETIAEGQAELAWQPVVEGSVEKYEDGEWKKVDGEYTPAANDKVRYLYNNVIIPQNDLPLLVAEMDSIALIAKARRIAIYYSQMAA